MLQANYPITLYDSQCIDLSIIRTQFVTNENSASRCIHIFKKNLLIYTQFFFFLVAESVAWVANLV